MITAQGITYQIEEGKTTACEDFSFNKGINYLNYQKRTIRRSILFDDKSTAFFPKSRSKGEERKALLSILSLKGVLGETEKSQLIISPVNTSLIGLRQHFPPGKSNWVTSVLRFPSGRRHVKSVL